MEDVVLSIVKDKETDEYKVTWKEGKKYSEAKTYYTNDLVDAVLTLVATARKARRLGYNVKISSSKLTSSALHRAPVLVEVLEVFDLNPSLTTNTLQEGK